MTEQPTTELAVQQNDTSLGVVGPPSPAEWAAMKEQVVMLANSRLVPGDLRGKPEDIMVIALAGRELSLPPMAALNKIHVIDGRPTLAAELMVALVLRAGHELVVVESDSTHALVKGRRRGSDQWQTVTFTMEEAQGAGITGKGNWKKYPAAMLRARAISALCRFAFADVLLGNSYTPDELGAETDAAGNVLEAQIAQPQQQPQQQQDPDGPPDWLPPAVEKYGEPMVIEFAEALRSEIGVGKGEITALPHLFRAPSDFAEELLDRLERSTKTEPSKPEHPCPSCGSECQRQRNSDTNKEWWRCSNDECTGGEDGKSRWISFHNDPWKPGGQIDQMNGWTEPPGTDSPISPPVGTQEQASAESFPVSADAASPEVIEGEVVDNETASAEDQEAITILNRLADAITSEALTEDAVMAKSVRLAVKYDHRPLPQTTTELLELPLELLRELEEYFAAKLDAPSAPQSTLGGVI